MVETKLDVSLGHRAQPRVRAWPPCTPSQQVRSLGSPDAIGCHCQPDLAEHVDGRLQLLAHLGKGGHVLPLLRLEQEALAQGSEHRHHVGRVAAPLRRGARPVLVLAH